MTHGGPPKLVRPALGALWLLLATAKTAFPAAAQMAKLDRAVGVPAAALEAAYWILTALEAIVGIGLLSGRAPGAFARASFAMSGVASLVWIAVLPLRSGCPCVGALIRLTGPAKLLLLLALFTASFKALWNELPTGRGDADPSSPARRPTASARARP